MVPKKVYIAAWLWICLIPLCARAAGEMSCYTCHEQQRAAEENAIHLQEGVTCVDCHGGNPGKTDLAGAHSENFTGAVAQQAIPEFCARCHSDVRRMNSFGISTDQYSQYLTSRHGEALQQGKTDVATCVDCHSTHGIRQVRDPRSPVHPRNVPATCGRCHTDSALMGKYGIPTTSVPLYLESVHADILLKKDDLSAPTCVTCHGNHGATPPGFREIRLVCGKCHIRQQELFAESPHAPLAEAGMHESCVACHSNHKILTRIDDIKEQCMACHSEQDDAMKRRDKIFTLIRSADSEYAKTTDRLAGMIRFGFHTEDEQVRLEEAKTSVLQLPPIQHTLSLEKVQMTSDAVQITLKELNTRMDRMESMERLKRAALIPVWLFFICMSVVFWAKKKRLQQGSGREDESHD